jgi:2-hydroxymuconate-semialdehyde hydrolase
MTTITNPELGHRVNVANYLDMAIGDQPPVLLLRGSGPGVSAWADNRFVGLVDAFLTRPGR